MEIDWDDPVARLRLVERVGIAEYNRLYEEHRQKIIIVTVNGHAIRPANTRFGRLFVVGATGKAFATLPEAEAYARDIKA